MTEAPPALTPEEEALYNMSDEELEAAVKAAKAGEVEIDEPEDLDTEEVEEVDGEEEEIEEEEELEQPDEEDSDEDEEGEETEDETEEESDDPDGDEEDEPTEESTEDKEPEVIKPQTYKVKANGTEFEFSVDELTQLAPKAMDYTRKMQEIAPWRKTISALKDNELSHNDVNLMIDALSGDKDAVTTLIKKSGVDALELDTEQEVKYTPKEYGRSEQELAIEDVVGAISKDPEYKITQHVVDSQWDAKSRSTLADKPEYIEGLHADIKSGVFDQVSPMAMKIKVLDGGRKSDIDYYIEAGRQYYADKQVTEAAQAQQAQESKAVEEKLLAEKEAVDGVKQRQEKQKVVKSSAKKRKAAAPTKKAAGKKDVVDYLDESEEAFEDWYKKLQASI